MPLSERLDSSLPHVGKPAQSNWDSCMLTERITTLLGFLSPEERVQIFCGSGTFCADCGDELDGSPCKCWGDYLTDTRVITPEYKCCICEVSSVKLWRDYNRLHPPDLYCFICATSEEYPKEAMGPLLARFKAGETDTIGFLVPAVPTQDGETYWGYTSVPQGGVDWWRKLPLFNE